MPSAVSPLAPTRVPTLPEIPGVRLATAAAGIRYPDRTDVMLALFAPGTTVAGVFTRSKCPSAPVEWCRERIKAGISDARKRGKAHGRPRAKNNDAAQIRILAQQGLSQAAIARHLGLWRTSVRRVLAPQEGT